MAMPAPHSPLARFSMCWPVQTHFQVQTHFRTLEVAASMPVTGAVTAPTRPCTAVRWWLQNSRAIVGRQSGSGWKATGRKAGRLESVDKNFPHNRRALLARSVAWACLS
eukprot:360629-Chlamydomonas_euryale.AAC.2